MLLKFKGIHMKDSSRCLGCGCKLGPLCETYGCGVCRNRAIKRYLEYVEEFRHSSKKQVRNEKQS